MRCTNHHHVADGGVFSQCFIAQNRPFDFLGSNAVPGDVDHVIGPSVERVCTVFVLARIIALCVSEFAVPATEVHLVKSSNVATPVMLKQIVGIAP